MRCDRRVAVAPRATLASRGCTPTQSRLLPAASFPRQCARLVPSPVAETAASRVSSYREDRLWLVFPRRSPSCVSLAPAPMWYPARADGPRRRRHRVEEARRAPGEYRRDHITLPPHL